MFGRLLRLFTYRRCLWCKKCVRKRHMAYGKGGWLCDPPTCRYSGPLAALIHGHTCRWNTGDKTNAQ